MPIWTKKKMTRWYNEFATDEEIADDEIVSVPGALHKLIAGFVGQLVASMNLRDADRVLDAGCGAGRFICRIRRIRNCRIVGIDTSRKMIERARKRVPDADYLRADVLHMPFVGGCFTVIICFSALWHIPSETGSPYFNRDIYEKGLGESRRVLEAGGRILFNISNPFHLQSIIELLRVSIKAKLLKNAGLRTYQISLNVVENMLTTLGFKISDLVAGGYYPMPLEIFYLPFGRTPSENTIYKYYNGFDRLANSLKRIGLWRTLAHTFVITAINLTGPVESVFGSLRQPTASTVGQSSCTEEAPQIQVVA